MTASHLYTGSNPKSPKNQLPRDLRCAAGQEERRLKIGSSLKTIAMTTSHKHTATNSQWFGILNIILRQNESEAKHARAEAKYQDSRQVFLWSAECRSVQITGEITQIYLSTTFQWIKKTKSQWLTSRWRITFEGKFVYFCFAYVLSLAFVSRQIILRIPYDSVNYHISQSKPPLPPTRDRVGHLKNGLGKYW